MSLQNQFDKAAASIKELTSKPTDEELLELYALFKQGTVGDVNTDRPGMLDFKGKTKWTAWDKKKGMSQNDAMEEYVKVAEGLKSKYG